MTKVEPLNIATNRERLTTALAVLNELKAYDRKVKEDPETPAISAERIAEIQVLLEELAPETTAIYYTLRLNGAEESDFAEKILEVTVDEICISVEQISDTEVRCYYLPADNADAPVAAV